MKNAASHIPDAAQRNPGIASPDSDTGSHSPALEVGSASVALSDKKAFQTINGLWKGKKPPFARAIVIRNTNFTNDGILNLVDAATLDVEMERLASRTLRRGDIIVERSGGGPKQPVGRVCYFDSTGEFPYSFSNFTSVIRLLDRTRLLPQYVHYFLLHLYKNGYTKGLQHATTGIRNLDFASYLEAEIPLRPLPEQQKLAAVLWKLQRTVLTQDRLIATTIDLRQAAMQRLFTCGLRGEPLKDTDIGPVPQNWDVAPVGNYLLLAQYGLSIRGQPLGHYPFLRMNCQADGETLFRDLQFVDLDDKTFSAYRLRPGDLLFNRTNSYELVGRMSIVRSEQDAVFASYLIRLTLDVERIDPEFVNYYFSRIAVQQDLKRLASRGVSQSNISASKLKTYVIPVPQVEEQREIAAALATIDRKLAHHQRKRAALNDLFQTMLHGLMTGRTRVADLDIDTSEVATPMLGGEPT